MEQAPIPDSEDEAPPRPRPTLSHGMMPTWLGVVLVVAVAANSRAGIIYWAVHRWLVDLILSTLLQGFGLISILLSVTTS